MSFKKKERNNKLREKLKMQIKTKDATKESRIRDNIRGKYSFLVYVIHIYFV